VNGCEPQAWVPRVLRSLNPRGHSVTPPQASRGAGPAFTAGGATISLSSPVREDRGF